MTLYLETVTGKLLDVTNPQPEQIDINDIAWGLSRLPRFAGHTITEVPYNVAQHSLLVAEITSDILLDVYGEIPRDVQKAVDNIQDAAASCTFSGGYEDTLNRVVVKALLHDAAEVYIGDIPSPVKKHPQIYPAIKEVEGKLMAAILKSLHICVFSDDETIVIHFADMVARAIEAHAFMHSRGKDWNLPPVSLVRLQKFEPPMTSVVSYNKFLEKFRELY